MSKVEEKIRELGLEMPETPKPVANYVPAVRFCENLVYLSGQDCRKNGKLLYEGRLGDNVTIEQGVRCTEQAALNCLAELKSCIGDLDKVKRIVKLLGFVACTDDFGEMPAVMNGASNLLVELYGEKGRHARAALGTNALPFNAPVEIEMIVEVEPE